MQETGGEIETMVCELEGSSENEIKKVEESKRDYD